MMKIQQAIKALGITLRDGYTAFVDPLLPICCYIFSQKTQKNSLSVLIREMRYALVITRLIDLKREIVTIKHLANLLHKTHKTSFDLYIMSSRDFSLQKNIDIMIAENFNIIDKLNENSSNEMDEIKQKLENCFQITDRLAEFEEFLIEIADLNDISVDEARINAKKVTPLLREFKFVVESFEHNNKLFNLLQFIELNNILGDIVSQHWDYLPPNCKEVIKSYYHDKYETPDETKETAQSGKIKVIKKVIKALLFLCRVTIKYKRNILVELKEALDYFITSMQEVLKDEEEDRMDWEAACAARESIKQYGTVKWEDLKSELGIKFDEGGNYSV